MFGDVSNFENIAEPQEKCFLCGAGAIRETRNASIILIGRFVPGDQAGDVRRILLKLLESRIFCESHGLRL